MQTPKKSFDTPPQHRLSKSTSAKNSPAADEGGRFIPNRVHSNLKLLFEKAERETKESPQKEEGSQVFSDLVHSQLFGFHPISNEVQRNLLRYKPETNAFENKENMPLFPIFPTQQMINDSPRKLPKLPYKILDAPHLKDDFYYDVLDWSSKNILAVGLNSQVYLWNASSSQVSLLYDLGTDMVTSINWSPSGNHVALGTESGKLKIYDIQQSALLQEMPPHIARIGTISWNNMMISTGSRDGNIINRDMRSGEVCSRIQAHRQEICGIKWSPDGQYLASGGNDNKLLLWTAHSTNSVGMLRGHTAAVKAIDWSPHQNGILASGGGTADKTLRFWNIHTLEEVSCIDTKSQICNMRFSKNSQELVTTHGYSQNHIIVWRYPNIQQVGVLRGHTSRVLYLSMSPDSENIVTGAGDETLRFWKLFPKQEDNQQLVSAMILNVNNLR